MYKTSKPSILHPFPKPGNPHLDAGVSRNFEIFDPLQFLAEFTQHIPNKGEHTVHHYGFYSNKNRGSRKKQPCENKERSSSLPQPEAYSEYSAKQRLSWAALIRCVFEINPLLCPTCGGTMKIIAFIDKLQEGVIQKILTRSTGMCTEHCEAARRGLKQEVRDEPLWLME